MEKNTTALVGLGEVADIANRVGHGVLLYTNKIPSPILSLFILEIKYQYQFLPLKNTNKIPIPILHLFKAIPCYSNSTPILKFFILSKPMLPGILIPSCDYAPKYIYIASLMTCSFYIDVKFLHYVLSISDVVEKISM